ncbi:MAG TPA: hypothetical protein VH327_05150, partial [Gammaproteobacteria bacterium]|nr:hypothetical protein [Gammaproteobacteria bacterium]
MMDTRTSRASRQLLHALSHPYVLFLLVALAIWLPQGFNIGPVNDGWINLSSGFLRGDPTRVFGNLPIRLGRLISPRNFVGIQLVILTMVLLHATLFYEIVKRLLPGRCLIALAAGLIGLFHNADRSYFWVGAMGLQFSLATALGSALCAILYLDQGRRRYLFATLALQLVSVCTYPAFVPLILGVPFGAWLLRRFSGARPSVSLLPKIGLVLVAAGCMYAYMLHLGAGHNAKVADVRLAAALSGYTWALKSLFRSVSIALEDLQPGYYLMALLAAVLAFPAVAAAAGSDQSRPPGPLYGWRYLGVVLIGLLLLALASYLPYSISNIRYQNSRTLLACGMFAYTALLIVLLAWVQPRVHKTVLILLVMMLT